MVVHSGVGAGIKFGVAAVQANLAKFLEDKDVTDNELLQRRCSHRTQSVYAFLCFSKQA